MNKFRLCFLLSSLILITGSNQQEWPPSPLPTFGCKQKFDLENCISKVYCVNNLQNINYYDNSFNRHGYNCENKENFYYNGYTYYDTHYTLKHFNNLDNFFNRDWVTILTGLDLSGNEYTDAFELKNMPRLKMLNVSRNLFTVAKLSNGYDLKQLSEIDFSCNTINSVVVNVNEYVFRKLKKLNLSNNYLVELQDGIFDYLNELEHLDLSYNFLDTLNILTFEGLKKIEYLNLKHNRLAEVGSSLLRFSRLRNLDLSENKIEQLKNADFEKLVNLVGLDLNSNLIKEIESNVFDNNVELQILNLSNNLLENIAKTTFVNQKMLNSVDLSKNNIRSLPSELFQDTHISSFSLTENKLEGPLTKGTFDGIFVTELDLSNQKLQSIEDHAFFGLVELKTLLLNNNQLNMLSKKSFTTLRSLEVLDLSSNLLANVDFEKDDLLLLSSLILKQNLLLQIKSDSFNGLNSLQLLDLSNNNISQLETNSFKSLKELINLQISNNPISGILEEGTFDGLNSLPGLDISGTLLTTIKNGSFAGLTQLKKFNISHSKVTEIQYNSFIHTGLIETLDLSFNELKQFHINTTELNSLNKLILNNNLLTTITKTCLNGLPRLTSVIVSYNQLKTIDENAFNDQKDLRYLDLSHNTNLKLNVTEFEDHQNLVALFLSGIQTNITFEVVKQIKVSRLDISHDNIENVTSLGLNKLNGLDNLALNYNNISKIDAESFSGVSNLRKLDLSFNKLNFIQPGAFKGNTFLHFLNVSHNMLTTLSYGIFRGLIYLDTIDISFNEISDLQSERFYEVNSLSVLIADQNKITNINFADFAGTNLKKLSIGGNPIPCHVLVNLIRMEKDYEITAIRLDEKSDAENVNGVTCNMDRVVTKLNKETEHLHNDKVFFDIRDILHNISSYELRGIPAVTVNNNDSKYLNSINSKIDEANAKTSLLLEKVSSTNINSNITNILLDKILKAVTVTKTVQKKDPVLIPLVSKENITADSLVSYMNKIKSDLEENIEMSIAAEKQNILNEIDDKISNKLSKLVTHKETLLVTEKSTQEAQFNKDSYDSNSLLFLEVCAGLILVILVAFILYKFYNSGMFVPSRHTTSTRHLSDNLENSAL